MARPKSNQKLVEHLHKHLDRTIDSIDKCLKIENYLQAEILKGHRDCLFEAIELCGKDKKKEPEPIGLTDERSS